MRAGRAWEPGASKYKGRQYPRLQWLCSGAWTSGMELVAPIFMKKMGPPPTLPTSNGLLVAGAAWVGKESGGTMGH